MGQNFTIRKLTRAIATAQGLTVPMWVKTAEIIPKKSAGIFSTVRPRKSFTCCKPIITAMPFVKPITIETGMKRMRPPSLKSPIRKRMKPEPKVANIRFESPYCAMIP